jgi:hypothetical protein
LTVLAVVLALVLPGRVELIAHVAVLLLAAFGLGALVGSVRAGLPPTRPSAFDAALRPRTRKHEQLPELASLEREVALGTTTAFDLHYRLRPPVRRIASELLAARRGVDLDADRDAAQRVLGADAWELVRADREPPRDRYAPGAELESIRRVVASLEAL